MHTLILYDAHSYKRLFCVIYSFRIIFYILDDDVFERLHMIENQFIKFVSVYCNLSAFMSQHEFVCLARQNEVPCLRISRCDGSVV